MIGYNEYQEAMNLLELLQESRQRLESFNASDEQIAEAAGIDPSDGQALRSARAEWYAALACWAQEKRCSGKYALCFTNEKAVQRKPYDLLACLPPQADETMEADVPAELLRGLAPEMAQRARKLYYRLLCIQPMRLLLTRLITLQDALEKAGTKRMETLCGIVETEKFRRPIPLLMERSSGTKLDLTGNNFTILDRLMDNWDRRLCQQAEFSLPRAAMAHTACAEALMTTAIVHQLHDTGARRQYRSIPGGHIALGVYGEKNPAQFFDAVASNQKRSKSKLLRVQGYAGTQLVQLTGTALHCYTEAPEESFWAADDGGRRLIGAIYDALDARRQLQGEACLDLLLKERDLTDEQRCSALKEVRRIATEFFREARLPKKINGEVGRIKNSSTNLTQRIVCLFLAHLARGGMLILPCPGGTPPQELLALIDRMSDDPAVCAAFVQDVAGMEAAKTRLDLRYVGKGDKRILMALRGQEGGWEAPVDWLAKAAKEKDPYDAGEPPFDTALLRAVMLEGLTRFIYFGRQVGTGESAAFTLKVESVGPRAKDIYFRLLCLWCMLECNGDENVRLMVDTKNPENSVFMMRKGQRTFVELFARTDTAADAMQLTPAKLRSFLRQTVGKTLRIQSEKDESFTISRPV